MENVINLDNSDPLQHTFLSCSYVVNWTAL